MQELLKLWDRPTLAKSFQAHQGKSIVELISDSPDVILWHVKNHNWQLSDVAKAEMALKKKLKA